MHLVNCGFYAKNPFLGLFLVLAVAAALVAGLVLRAAVLRTAILRTAVLGPVLGAAVLRIAVLRVAVLGIAVLRVVCIGALVLRIGVLCHDKLPPNLYCLSAQILSDIHSYFIHI